jgi:signal transduction histidine kinase
MRIMRERADGIGAELRVQSAPGAGTTVEAFWTMHPAHAQEGKEYE